jgi:phosphoribosylformimino-5-aminoimidazole carboxamide ribotide isomerase
LKSWSDSRSSRKSGDRSRCRIRQWLDDDLVELIASRAVVRVGGGVRSPERARTDRARRTSRDRRHRRISARVAAADRRRRDTGTPDHRARFQSRKSGGEKLAGSDRVHRPRINRANGTVLLRLPLHLRRPGRHDARHRFYRLRASTKHEITAAGGITTIEDIHALAAMGVHAAVGMATYTGKLSLDELAGLGH